MNPKLVQSREMFPKGAILECLGNTYIPDNAGLRVVVERASASFRDCRALTKGAGGIEPGKPFRLSSPTKVGDICDISDDGRSICYRIDRLDDAGNRHICTWRDISEPEHWSRAHRRR